MNLTPAQQALLGYMEGASENRWSAGWLIGLEKALVGDPAYDWLVKQAGGTFVWDNEATELINGRRLKWVSERMICRIKTRNPTLSEIVLDVRDNKGFEDVTIDEIIRAAKIAGYEECIHNNRIFKGYLGSIYLKLQRPNLLADTPDLDI